MWKIFRKKYDPYMDIVEFGDMCIKELVSSDATLTKKQKYILRNMYDGVLKNHSLIGDRCSGKTTLMGIMASYLILRQHKLKNDFTVFVDGESIHRIIELLICFIDKTHRNVDKNKILPNMVKYNVNTCGVRNAPSISFYVGDILEKLPDLKGYCGKVFISGGCEDTGKFYKQIGDDAYQDMDNHFLFWFDSEQPDLDMRMYKLKKYLSPESFYTDYGHFQRYAEEIFGCED